MMKMYVTTKCVKGTVKVSEIVLPNDLDRTNQSVYIDANDYPFRRFFKSPFYSVENTK